MRTVTVDEEESTIIIYDNWRQVGQTTLFCSHEAPSLLPHTTSGVSVPRLPLCSAASHITVLYTSAAAVARHPLQYLLYAFNTSYLNKDMYI